jgi:Trk-type K+ transport system membrane component
LTETVRYLVRTAAPILLYAAGFVPVIVGAIVVVSVIENTIGFDNFTTFRYYVAAATAWVILIGALVFALLDGGLVWLERLRRPTVRDHLRHCVALYTILVILVVALIATYENSAAHGIYLGYGLVVTALFVVGYAISIDATILALQRRHFDRASPGDVT